MSAAAHRRGTWRVLAPWARRHRGQLGGAAALAVVESAVDLARPWPLAFAVDSAIGGRPVSGPLRGISPTGLLIVAGGALLLLSLVGGLAAYGVTLLAERGAERIGADLREATFGAAVRL